MARPFLARWRELVASSPLTTTQRAIAWRAADYANSDGTRCYPSSVLLARDCGLKVSEVDRRNKVVERALAALVACGLAVKVGVGHRGRSAEYRLTIPGEERGTPQSPNLSERGTPQWRKGGLPSPPTYPDHRGGAPNAPRRPARHAFVDDGSGLSCSICGLGAAHSSHGEAA